MDNSKESYDLCPTCMDVGGYCGHCDGASWNRAKKKLPKKDSFKFKWRGENWYVKSTARPEVIKLWIEREVRRDDKINK